MVINTSAVNAFDANPENLMLDCQLDYIQGSSVPNQIGGLIRTDLASLSIIFQIIILTLSEIGWPIHLFDRYFPVLGPDFGLGVLGIFQCLLSIQILSHFVDDFTLVSAFSLFGLGCINILLGIIFSQSAKVKRSIRYWRGDIRSSSQDNLNSVFVNNSIPLTDLSSTSEAPSIKRQEDEMVDIDSSSTTSSHKRPKIREKDVKYFSIYD